jgi:hypothetical protein
MCVNRVRVMLVHVHIHYERMHEICSVLIHQNLGNIVTWKYRQRNSNRRFQYRRSHICFKFRTKCVCFSEGLWIESWNRYSVGVSLLSVPLVFHSKSWITFLFFNPYDSTSPPWDCYQKWRKRSCKGRKSVLYVLLSFNGCSSTQCICSTSESKPILPIAKQHNSR